MPYPYDIGDIPITGRIGLTNIVDTYATFIARLGQGGWQDVETVADRDSIPLARREFGMGVVVNADPTPTNNTIWMLCNIALGGTSNTLTDNSNWVNIASGALAVQTVTDDGNGVVNVDNTDPQNPIIGFAGVNVDNVTVTGDGTSGSPLVATSTGSGTGLDGFALQVRVATTAVLPGSPTYANGASGVGATLTRGSNGTLGTIDGITPFTVGDRILVKNQAAQLQNGIYEVTTVGNGGAAYVLTRTTDADQTVEMDDQVVVPALGTTNGGQTFGQQTVSPTIGTNNIVYTAGSVFVKEQTSGTQILGQIPWWITTNRTLSKGTQDFTWDNTNKIFIVGDTLGAANSTVFYLDDSLSQINFTAGLSGFAKILIDGGNNIVTLSAVTSIDLDSYQYVQLKNTYDSSLVCELRFTEANTNGANFVGFKAPDALANDLIYTLPTADPIEGQVLFTSVPTSGVSQLYWSGPANGSFIKIDDANQKIYVNKRFEEAKGAGVASGATVTLGGDGNLFPITGATTLNTISSTNWQEGSVIILHFTSNPTVKHATAGAGTGLPLKLAGSVDFAAATDSRLQLYLYQDFWYEISRTIA